MNSLRDGLADFVDWSELPPAAHSLCYVPERDRYQWRDCLGRHYSRPSCWFVTPRVLGITSAVALLSELEVRVTEWWRPAA